MTITYDAETKRATHMESGMFLEFDCYSLYIQESAVFVNLCYDEQI
jgi:hypothetical protein